MSHNDPIDVKLKPMEMRVLINWHSGQITNTMLNEDVIHRAERILELAKLLPKEKR